MQLKNLSPILWTKDLQATVLFYETILGFSSRSSFPNFVSLTKDGVDIMFIIPEEDPEDCREPGADFFPEPLLTGSLFILVTNVDELWERVSDKVTIKTTIADRPYQMRDFSILDNNGYEVVFGEDISHRAQ